MTIDKLKFFHHSILFTAIFLFSQVCATYRPEVSVGIDVLINNEEYISLLKGKRIGLITNHTAINSRMQSTIDLIKSYSKPIGYTLSALFAPEHGITGSAYAAENIEELKDPDGIPIFSLHGKTRRPTDEMLKKVNLLIYDIQDIGSRSYTYITTLFYAMEAAAEKGIPVIVLDRPNPINGIIVDGPMMEEKWRSMIGYINVPYCHGMTIGELAQFFNIEYKIGCDLKVIPMSGWNRRMAFHDTGLAWVPTSPNIPESSTAYYYPTTGFLGELSLVNIGIGYTLPFKLVGAPWIDAKKFAQQLNSQKFPGVYFKPFYYRPFYGKFSHEDCEGVLIVITNPMIYKPVCTQYLIIGILKSMYPTKFKEALAEATKTQKELFCKVNGTEEVYRIITEEKNIVWKLKTFHQNEREAFLAVRKKYLIPRYSVDP